MEIISFYKGLMGSSTSRFQIVDRSMTKRGPKWLCGELTKDELWKGLKSIGDDKFHEYMNSILSSLRKYEQLSNINLSYQDILLH